MIDIFQQWLWQHYGIQSKLAYYAANLLVLFAILALILLIDLLAKQLINKLLKRVIQKSKNHWDDIIYARNVFNHLSHLAPAVFLYLLSPVFPNYQNFLQRLTLTFMIVIGILVTDSILDAIIDIYNTLEMAKRVPIKGYIQVGKIFLFTIGGIFIMATLVQRSPWLLLSGMGALTAVLLLVFRDSLLGLVASIQISSSDLVRIGDWIEVPHFNADGEVLDISLHVVKVRNWDKTITTIPTYSLISESFKNWRGMQESGGRRIKRTMIIDMTSIQFCTEEMLERFEKIHLIADYIKAKRAEIAQFNRSHQLNTQAHIANGRRLTNIGTFRAYLQAYLQNHPKLHKNMPILVRHLAPTENGLPIEVYAFTNDTSWTYYEAVQADIFDHIFSILPGFGLRVFQAPSGHDLQGYLQEGSLWESPDEVESESAFRQGLTDPNAD